MSPAAILALVSALETIIQDTPQALALFRTVKTMLTGGTAPSPAQWAALAAALATDHAAIQAG